MGQERVVTVVLLQLGDFAVFVVEVAKYKGVSRTSLRASCLNLAINHFTVLAFGVPDASSDALDTEGALLHDSAASNRDVGVQMVAERLGPNWLPVVEETHDIWATVGTVPSADATVVYLNVQAFVAVVRRKYRAYRLARRVFAVLAHDRDEPCLDVREFAFPVAFHADPRHDPRTLKAVLKVQRNVVLGLTGQDTRLTTGALVDIDDHAPAVVSFFSLQCHVVNPRSWYARKRLPLISGLLLTLLRPLHLCQVAGILAGRCDGWQSPHRARFRPERQQELARQVRSGTQLLHPQT